MCMDVADVNVSHNQCHCGSEYERTNREYAWACLILSSVGCECEGKLDTPCLLEPWCDTHKLSLVWIVLPFHFFSVKRTLDVIWLWCKWAINLDRCPTKNGATPGKQQHFTYAKLKTLASLHCLGYTSVLFHVTLHSQVCYWCVHVHEECYSMQCLWRTTSCFEFLLVQSQLKSDYFCGTFSLVWLHRDKCRYGTQSPLTFTNLSFLSSLAQPDQWKRSMYHIIQI